MLTIITCIWQYWMLHSCRQARTKSSTLLLVIDLASSFKLSFKGYTTEIPVALVVLLIISKINMQGWDRFTHSASPHRHLFVSRIIMVLSVVYPCGRLWWSAPVRQKPPAVWPNTRYRVSCGAERAHLFKLSSPHHSFCFSFHFGHSGFYNNLLRGGAIWSWILSLLTLEW